jgi:hypothetical protein
MAFVAAGSLVSDLIAQEIKKQAFKSGVDVIKGVRNTTCSAIPINRPFLRAAIGCGTQTSSRSFGGRKKKKKKKKKKSKPKSKTSESKKTSRKSRKSKK